MALILIKDGVSKGARPVLGPPSFVIISKTNARVLFISPQNYNDSDCCFLQTKYNMAAVMQTLVLVMLAAMTYAACPPSSCDYISCGDESQLVTAQDCNPESHVFMTKVHGPCNCCDGCVELLGK